MKVEDCHMENPVDENHIYQKDCFAVGLSFVRGHATTIGSISMAIACIMVSTINDLLPTTIHFKSIFCKTLTGPVKCFRPIYIFSMFGFRLWAWFFR